MFRLCLYFFYKRLALGWQNGKQLSGFNLFSLSNNKTATDFKKVELFLCNKHKLAVKVAIHHDSAVSKTLLRNL